MPYTSEGIKLSERQDRRRKLTAEQIERIRWEYENVMPSQRKLAAKYGVSRSLIQIYVRPNRAEYVRNRIKEHWRDYRPTKEEWAETIKEHRHYKQDLYLKGKLVCEQ